MYEPRDLWLFLPIGYLITVAIEGPILCFALSHRHPIRDRIIAGLWLTGVTYPIVVVTMPLLLEPRWLYLTVAETFAPAAECGLFYVANIRRLAPADRRATLRDFGAIIAANLASFGLGELYARLSA